MKEVQQTTHFYPKEKIGAWTCDVVNKKTHWSEDMYTILGLAPQKGQPDFINYKKILPPQDYEILERDVQKALQYGTPYCHELHIIRPDGEMRVVINQGQGIQDDNGKIAWLFGTTQDITEQKKIEQRLKESEAMLDYIEERSGVGSFSWDLTNDTLLYSRNMLSMAGLDRESLPNTLRETIASMIHPADRKKIKEEIAAMIDCKKTWPMKFRICKPDGEERIWESHAKFFFDEQGEPVKCIGIHQDITDAIETQENLQLLGNLVEAFPAAITVHDFSGKFLYANQKTLELHGYKTKEELFSKTLYEIDNPESRELIQERMDLIRKQGHACFEVMHVHKDGSLIPLEVHVRMTQWKKTEVLLSIALDITERKKIQAAIEEQIFFQQSLMNAMPVPVFYKGLDGKYLGCNKAFEDFFGYSHEWIIGKTAEDIASHDLAEIYEAQDQRVFQSQRASKLETHASSEDGHFHDVIFYKAPFFNRKGDMEGLIGIIMDVTEQHILESRIRQTEKMEALGQFAGGIAHDFNNQLMCIIGHTEMIALNSKEYNIQNHAKIILKSAESAAELARKMLFFAQKSKQNITHTDLHGIIEDVLSILEHSIDKKIAIQKKLNAKPSYIIGDISQIQNALMNLALNARDAMPRGGELIFKTQNVQIEKGKYPDLAPGSYIEVMVKDTGIGMDPETLKHIFEPFFTTKEEGKGTGMGLTCVYSMIKNHHGAIDVISLPQQGSDFFLYFPIAEKINEDHKSSQNSPRLYASLAAKILVIDDEETICNLTSQTLHALGYQSVTYKDPVKAIEYYKKSYKEISLVIIDMLMPVLNGKETFLLMKEIYPPIKAILSSGYVLNAEAQEALDKGMLCFLQKPYRIQDLKQKIENALRKKT